MHCPPDLILPHTLPPHLTPPPPGTPFALSPYKDWPAFYAPTDV